MPRPPTPLHLVQGHSDFPFDEWKTRFGPYNYFRTPGYKKMVYLIEILRGEPKNLAIRQVKKFLGPAAASLTGGWINPIGAHHWDTIREQHISECYSNSCRFDKAALAIVALEYALAAEGLRIDVYDHVQICPTIYLIPELDQGMINHMKQTTVAGGQQTVFSAISEVIRLSDATNPIKPDRMIIDSSEDRFLAFLGEIIKGFPITLPAAQKLVGLLRHHGIATKLSIKRLSSRTDGDEIIKKRPNAFESMPVDLELLRGLLPNKVMERIPYFNQGL